LQIVAGWQVKGVAHTPPAQQTSFGPPQGRHVGVGNVNPVRQIWLASWHTPPAQQGWPGAPQAQVPDAQALVVPSHHVPPQHGWVSAPHVS
jgi:hypothetical protein